MPKIAVRYCTRTGHSKQLAESVAAALGLEAKDISAGLDEPVDQLFLCNGMYAATLDRALKDFLEISGKEAGEIVNVCSSASGRSTRKPLQKLAEACGFNLSSREFCCKGAFHFLSKGHPDADDLRAAANFAILTAKRR